MRDMTTVLLLRLLKFLIWCLASTRRKETRVPKLQGQHSFLHSINISWASKCQVFAQSCDTTANKTDMIPEFLEFTV